MLLEHGKLDGDKVLADLGEREPADLDEAEERLRREQAVVLMRVVHVPVGRDERRHEVEHLGDLARVGHRLIRKVGCRLDDGEVCRNSRWDGRDGPVEVASRARLSRIRWGITGVEGWTVSGDDGPLHMTFGPVDPVDRESCSDDFS